MQRSRGRKELEAAEELRKKDHGGRALMGGVTGAEGMSSGPGGPFLCHLVTHAKKFSFRLSSSELGLLHLHPQES